MTHPNETAQNACVVYAQLVWFLLNYPRDNFGAINHAMSFADPIVKSWLEKGQLTDAKDKMGWMRHALTMSFF